jgi:DNA helicase HerA-like ATPase
MIDTEEVRMEIRKLAPILGKEKASRLEIAYLLSDEDGRKKILEMIDVIKASAFSDNDLKESVLIQPPEKDVASHGDFQLGTILYGKKPLYPLFLNKSDLLTHIGVFGSSGSGKTNFLQWIVMELNRLEIPILIFDFSKRNYRDLLQIPELKNKIKIYTVGREVSPFKFNPLKPPEGVQISQWAKEFSEVFDHAYWLMGGGRYLILKALDELYRKLSPNYPRISDLMNWLASYKFESLSPRERNWLATAERPLKSLYFRETGNIFDVEEGIFPSTFFQKGRITILELDALATDDKTFFIEIILQWLRDWLLVSNVREKLIGTVILEEAHHVLNREKTRRFGIETVMDLVFREVRELGLGMIYADQHPSLLSYPALGNTSTHIYMNLGLDTKQSSDVQDAANMLGLKSDEETDYLRRLPIGHAFVLVRKSAFPNPFLVKFPLVEIEKGRIKDEDVGSLMEEFGLVLPGIKTATKKADVKDLLEGLNSTQLKTIEILGNGKACSTSEIYKLMKMSGSTFNKNAEKLLELELVGAKRGKVYKQRSIFFFLTDNGEEIFRSKFGEKKEEVGIDRMKVFVANALIIKGWLKIKERGNLLEFEKEGKPVIVALENSWDREKIREDLLEMSKKGSCYFIASSEELRNFIAQQSAKYASENERLSFTVHTSDIGGMKQGKWKSIEFESYS